MGGKKIQNSRKVVDFLYQHEHWGIMSAREKNGKVVVADIFGTWQNPRQDLVELCMLVRKTDFRKLLKEHSVTLKDVDYWRADKLQLMERAVEIIGQEKLKPRLLSFIKHSIPQNRARNKELKEMHERMQADRQAQLDKIYGK